MKNIHTSFMLIAFLLASCGDQAGLITLSFQDGIVESLNFASNQIFQDGNVSLSTLTYFQGYDDRESLQTIYRRIHADNARDTFLVDHQVETSDYLAYYLPASSLGSAENYLGNRGIPSFGSPFNPEEDTSYLDGRLYSAAASIGEEDKLRIAVFEKWEEIPVECSYGELVLVMERNWVRYLENLFTGERLDVEAPVVARKLLRKTANGLVEAVMPDETTEFSKTYELERSTFESGGLRLESASSPSTSVRQCPRMAPYEGAFSNYYERLDLHENDTLFLRRFRNGVDLLETEFDESYAEDPYGNLRPAFREAYVGRDQKNEDFGFYSLDVLKPYLLKEN